uniref:Putative ovule protein n=1 Tax=Solanum chacoense TaxID=4108 RepID=A0A0V0H9M8_SOLCH
MPAPGFDAKSVCSSTHPLKTEPKPPSPSTLSGRKFLVDARSSLKVKLLKLDDCKISPSLRGVGGTEPDDTLLFELLVSVPFPLAFLEPTPVPVKIVVSALISLLRQIPITTKTSKRFQLYNPTSQNVQITTNFKNSFAICI